MSDELRHAPGWPGIEPRWTSSAKTGAGTALNLHSRVWFTLSHGILNEIYFPRLDQACTRDFGLIVTDGREFFSEEKRHCTFRNLPFEPGVPAYELTNTDMDGRYRIEKEVLTDPSRHVVLQKIRFVPLKGNLGDYRLYALLASHLANFGTGNTGWVGDYKGRPMLFAQREGCALALGCSAPWLMSRTRKSPVCKRHPIFSISKARVTNVYCVLGQKDATLHQSWTNFVSTPWEVAGNWI